MKKILLVLIFFCVGTVYSYASHLMGGEISYVYVGGNNYEVTLIVYNDCAGATTSGSSQTIHYKSASCGINTSKSLPLFGSPVDVSQICPSALSTCSGGSNPGVSQRIYKGIISLPPCTDWIIYWTSNARNAAITNLVNPQVDFYIQATLNNVIGVNNNSPQFFTLPTPFMCANQLYVFNHGASDVDGDSIYYNLTTPLTGTTPPGTPMTFASGYSVNQPLSTTSGINLNQQTGEMCFTPNIAQFAVVSVLISEYRNGVLIGTQIREMQIVVDGNCNNQPPIAGGVATNCGGVGGMVITTQGPNVTKVDSNSIIMCPGDTICFNVSFSDLDAGDNVTITSNVATAIPTASFSITGNGTANAVASFCWVPTPLDSGLNVFTIQAKDDHCPISAISTFTYDVTVFDEPYAGQDVFICNTAAADSVQLLAQGGVNYVWSVLSGDTNTTHITCTNCDNPIVFPDSTTTYLLTSGGNFLCNNTDTVTIFVGQVPKPHLIDTAFCTGLSVPLDAGVGFGSLPYDSIYWNGSTTAGGQLFTVNQPGNYYVTVWQGGCSMNSDTNTVTQNALPIPNIIGNPASFHYCRTDSLTLTVTNSFVSYSWSPSGDTTSTVFIGNGIHLVTVVDTNGCVGTKSQLVTSSDPQVSIFGTDTICPDSNIVLTSVPTSFNSYSWSNGDSTALANASPGPITLIVADSYGCTDTASTTIYARPLPNAAFSIDPEIMGSTGTGIVFTDNSTGSPVFWDWSFGDTSNVNTQNPTHTYSNQGNYTITLMVKNQYGCSDTTTKSYFILDGIIIPNIFTPNGDGSNDKLVFKNVEFVENNLKIFDRWGNKVFEQANYKNDWDGDNLHEGTYFYILGVVLPGSTEIKTFKGSITILK